MSKRVERGASAVEYGLLIMGIAGLIAVVVFGFGNFISDNLHGSCDKISQEINSTNCP